MTFKAKYIVEDCYTGWLSFQKFIIYTIIYSVNSLRTFPKIYVNGKFSWQLMFNLQTNKKL